MAEELTGASAALNAEPEIATPTTDEAVQEVAETIALINEKSTPEQVAEFYTKLGRPESADKYGLQFQDDDNNEMANHLSKSMFDAGLNNAQATKIADAWNAYAKEQYDAYNKEQASQMEQVRAEWGKDYESNMEIARQAMRKYGLDNNETLGKLEHSLGSKNVLNLLYTIGKTIGDAPIKGTQAEAPKAVYNPKEATDKINELIADKEWAQKWMSGDKEAVRLFDELTKAQAGIK